MPLAELSITKGTFTQEKLDLLAMELTDIFLAHQGASPDSAAAKSITCIEIKELDSLRIFVGGERSNATRVRVVFTVPYGSLSEEKKASLVDETTRLLHRLEGSNLPIEDCYHLWVVVSEVPDGNWGAAGKVWNWKSIIRWVVRRDIGARRAEKAAAMAAG